MIANRSGLYGLAYVAGISLTAIWMDALSMQLAGALPWAQVHSLSHIAMLVVCLSIIALRRTGATLKTSCPKMMLFRSLTAVAALGFYYQALKTISLTEFVTINSLLPLIAGVISTITFQDRLSAWGWGAVIMGSGSVIGGYMVWDHHLSIGLFYAFVGMCFSVFTMQSARYIQLRETATVSLVFYPALCVSIVPFVIAPDPFEPFRGNLIYVFGIYVFLLISVRFLTMYTLKTLSVVGFGLFLNLQFVWAILIDIFYFNDSPETYELFIVVTVIISITLYIQKHKPAKLANLDREAGSTAT